MDAGHHFGRCGQLTKEEMKILIIGGTGFIGRHLVNHLEEEHQLLLIHRGKESKDSKFKSIKTDRRKIPSLRSIFEIERPEVVIDLIPYYAQDAWDIINTFRGISNSIIALSSGDVYQNYEVFKDNLPVQSELASKEDSPLRAKLFPYRGVDRENQLFENYDKILVEKIYQSQNEIRTTILRLAAVYGAYDSQRKLKQYIQPMIKGQKSVTINAKKATWKWTRVFVEEVCQAIRLSVDSEQSSHHEIFNVGEQESLSQIELLEKIKEITKWDGKIEVTEKQYDSFNYDQHLELNTQKIRDVLGYEEKFHMEEGLGKAVEFEKTVIE